MSMGSLALPPLTSCKKDIKHDKISELITVIIQSLTIKIKPITIKISNEGTVYQGWKSIKLLYYLFMILHEAYYCRETQDCQVFGQ